MTGFWVIVIFIAIVAYVKSRGKNRPPAQPAPRNMREYFEQEAAKHGTTIVGISSAPDPVEARNAARAAEAEAWLRSVAPAGATVSVTRIPADAPALDAESAGLRDELIKIYRSDKTYQSPKGSIRDIGARLNEKGGNDLMLKVHAQVKAACKVGTGRSLEMTWDGIGEWLG
jgi:hypothetical protein